MSDDTSPISRISTLFKGGSIAAIGVVVELGISFFAKVVLARWLGKVEYGAVSLGIMLMAMTSTIVLLGLPSGIGRFLPRYDDRAHRRGILLTGFSIVLPFSIVVGGILVLFAPTIATTVFDNPSTGPILRVFGLIIPLAATMKFTIGVVRGMQHTVPKVYIQNLSLPIARFAGIGVAIAFGFGTVGVAWAYAVSYAVAVTTGIYYLWRHTSLFEFGTEYTTDYRNLLAFSFPLLIMSAMSLIFKDIDIFFLGYYQSAGNVGIYNVVYPIAQLLLVAVTSFGFIFMPVLSELHSEGKIDEMARLYEVVTKWVFMSTLPLFLVFVLFPDLSLEITFGGEYRPGAPALVILGLGFITHTAAGPNMDLLTSIGRTRLIMYDNSVVAAVNLALNIVLIPRYSFIGAAVATAVAYALLNLLYTYQLYRIAKIQPLTPAMIKPTVIAVGLIGMIYVIAKIFVPLNLVTLPLLFGVFVTVYGISILRFGGIESEEVQLVLRFEDRFGVDLGPIKVIANWFIS
ncbi:Capsular polysaccharide biosynthesis protein [Halorhabdus tiamatea SARL4B]|uniref:Capsular polysaccharide biosynthesis protein n=1 Tax=Halorhabdus tiamatea SARL4B TaxID=1033806 RepID=F7PKC4_9EURY|nr:flippase [Halorhabdus tiamatea]ERJ06992.1 Capsular polysaccharide biosynthesis protein [Halorhabdus tiamatea SARL4B]CCQ34764.1 polysaccharide biosynthesis transport protein [Halorhabdus tiamatea SARL4B]